MLVNCMKRLVKPMVGGNVIIICGYAILLHKMCVRHIGYFPSLYNSLHLIYDILLRV